MFVAGLAADRASPAILLFPYALTLLFMSNTSSGALLRMLARLSFRLGEFRLSSGTVSDYYIDCRATTLTAEGGRLTGLAILEMLRARGLKPVAVGGLTLGADPVVSNVTAASAWSQRNQPDAADAGTSSEVTLVDGFLVRKAEKNHGAGRRIEGFCEAGAPVVVVDDVCTTGASTITAIEAAKAAGMRVIGVVCIVEREEAGGRRNVEAAAEGSPFLSLFGAREVRAEHLRILADSSDAQVNR